MINKNFRIDIVGDLDFEDLVADIYFKDEFFAMISQEEGFENLVIQIYPPKNMEKWTFKFSEFEETILFAKQRLWELRKIPNEDDN